MRHDSNKISKHMEAPLKMDAASDSLLVFLWRGQPRMHFICDDLS